MWLILACLLATAVDAAEGPVRSVATFESIGLYLKRPEAGQATVRYRVAGHGDWRTGYPLVYDPREREYRGSLVGLTPDTRYEITVEAGGKITTLESRTRSEVFPVGVTTFLPGGVAGEPLTIREGGTERAWRLITPQPGRKWVSDVFNLADNNIVVESDYVILRGLELKGAAQHAVLIKPGVHHVVIEDCRITGWGRIGGARVWGISHGSDSAIYAQAGAGSLVVQRNLIEHPRGGSNDWESGHPDGPQGIALINSSGGNVIRYNTIRSTEDHGYNDGIGGASNFSFEGSPNRDSDIYGNIISHCWDDAIESEGANANVRIWSNYIHHTFTHVATASTAMGPLYIFRNVFGSSRISHLDPSGGQMIKTGGRDVLINGEKVSTLLGFRFIFHNTALQPGGALDVFSGHELHNAVTRNNIFYSRGRTYPESRAAPLNDFRNDLKGGYLGGGFVSSMFLASEGLEWFLAPTMNRILWGRVEYNRGGKTFFITDPMEPQPNPALDKGLPLPGFNDDFAGAAPDIGAFENGRTGLRFGREMAPGFRRPPWELY